MPKLIIACFVIIGAILIVSFGEAIHFGLIEDRQREECIHKGGVWDHRLGVCLKIETIPVTP